MAEVGNNINQAALLLKQGGLVAIPTETVYGLAANALDEKAVARIFEAKRRPSFDPLIVHIGSESDALRFSSSFPPNAARLAEAFWPGPLTLILPKKDIPDLVTAGHSTVGIRMPDHPLTRTLLKQLPFPLAAPSANPFGYVSPTSAQHVLDQLSHQVDYILDGGNAGVGVESTIIECKGDEVHVLRLGGLPLEIIEEVLGHPVDSLKTSSSNPTAPGMRSSHYAPSMPVFSEAEEAFKAGYNWMDMGALRYDTLHADIPQQQQIVLSKSADLAEAAAHLFAALRQAETLPIKALLVEFVPDEGLGKAINDRLKRATSHG